jgi:prefoldin subunit 5
LVISDNQSKAKSPWLRRTLAYIVIFLGVIGLLASVAMGLLLYQAGSFLGETWGKANEGLKESSQTLLAVQDTVDMTSATVRSLEEGMGDASEALNNIGEGLISAERSTASIASTLSAFGRSLEVTGSVVPPTGDLSWMGSSLGEAGSDARDASESINSLNPVWQDLQEQNRDIQQALDNARTELSQVRRGLAVVSQGLEAGAVTVNSIASDLEVLRGSGVFLWVFIAGLVYFSAVSMCLILLGLLLLKVEIPQYYVPQILLIPA